VCTSLHQGITIVIVVVVVIVVAVLSRYLASCLPKYVVGDLHKIPPSHPEINPIPAHPNFTFAANAYLLSFFFRAPTLSRFFSPFHYIHHYVFHFSHRISAFTNAKLKARRTS